MARDQQASGVGPVGERAGGEDVDDAVADAAVHGVEVRLVLPRGVERGSAPRGAGKRHGKNASIGSAYVYGAYRHYAVHNWARARRRAQAAALAGYAGVIVRPGC